jgi:Beta propeller domain
MNCLKIINYSMRTLCDLSPLMLVILTACGGSGGSAAPNISQPAPLEKGLNRATQGQVLSYVRDRLIDGRIAPQSPVAYANVGVASPGAPSEISGGDAASPALVSSTTVQQAGVDEPDLLKTNGRYFYSLSPLGAFLGSNDGLNGNYASSASIGINRYDAIGQSASKVFDLTLGSGFNARGLFLDDQSNRLVVYGSEFVQLRAALSAGPINPSSQITSSPYYQVSNQNIKLEVLSVATPATPIAELKLAFEGNVISTRVVNRVLYVVSSFSPNIDQYALFNLTTVQARADALKDLSITQLLPLVSVNGGASQPLVSESDCFIQNANASSILAVTSITAIDLASPTLSRQSRCFIGGTEAVYATTKSIYIASTRSNYAPAPNNGVVAQYPAQMVTDVHKFVINRLDVSYLGSGEVAGHLGWDSTKKSYRMGEANDELRVLSFTGQLGWFIRPNNAGQAGAPAASPATLSVLKFDVSSQSLKLISTLPNSTRAAAIGKPGEQVYGVRFIGDKAYVVTFAQVDPLYVLDLSNSADPKIVGELLAPGFSDYLFPLANNLLLGVGKDASNDGRLQGLKIALFDVSNPASPKQLDQRVIGRRGTISALDACAQGINMLTVGDSVRVTLPVQLNDSPSSFSNFFDPTEQGLFRFEINTTSKTIVDKPRVLGRKLSGNPAQVFGYGDVFNDRAAQIDNTVFYLTSGAIKSAAW